MHAYHLQTQLGQFKTGFAPPPKATPPAVRIATAARKPMVQFARARAGAAPYKTPRRFAIAPPPSAPRATARPPLSTPLRYDPRSTVAIPGGARSDLPFYDEARAFTYTREQIREMQERGRAANLELEARQKREGGDGVSPDLEQRATEEAATDQAVRDSAGMRVPAATPSAADKPNLLPLALLAALAFMAGG